MNDNIEMVTKINTIEQIYTPVTLHKSTIQGGETMVIVAYSLFFLLIMGYLLLLTRRVVQIKKRMNRINKYIKHGESNE